MVVPSTVLEFLKCSNCEHYLSRGPVYLQHDGAAICGRCYTPEHSATRDKYYEATAKFLRFPCKNWELGCRETVPFVDEDEVIAHEEVCEHRQYVCPVLGSASCAWLGPRAAMLAHCRDEHQDNVFESPCTLTHDITRSSVDNYILPAFQLLFLLHTKVCVATGKIFHSVRLLGTSEEAADFLFTVDIKRNNDLLSKEGHVVPQGCLEIQEPTSVAVNTNSLLDVLGGFDGTTFTVTVQRRVSEAVEQLASRVQQLRTDLVTCARRACGNQSCGHTDMHLKCFKHEVFFCQQRTECHICMARVSPGTLSAHYASVHQDITCRSGSTWRATRTVRSQYRLVYSAAGTAVCWYGLTDTGFDLDVYIPVTSERLREFRCEMQVTHPTTRHTQTYTPDTRYDMYHDWNIKVKKQEFPSWNGEFEVIVKIIKTD